MKIKELIVPLAIVAMVVGMVLPLPTALLDMLLIVNLLLATALLLSALSVTDPLKLSALPTILLLATLYRLTLNISTTRLILSGGDAGQVVAAFGSVVIGGSAAIGLVIFLIITLIQFIVIAKGAERIAEVAARFTLDALPGKQMSVDADVRSGLIDVERARDKREELQIESRFYGALDGAMKFVKGDAIAGLAIVAVNIVGGICVGLLVEHLSIGGAVQKFLTLTIGDGLVSQIPALLNSLTAGIIVTKVARSEGSSTINELALQIGQGTMVRGLICFVSLLLGCLPGMPTVPFLIIGVVLLFMRPKVTAAPVVKAPALDFQPKAPALLAIGGESSLIESLRSSEAFSAVVERFRQNSFERYGFLLPRIELLVTEESKKGASTSASVFFRGALVRTTDLGEDYQEFHQSKCHQSIGLALADVLSEFRDEFVDDMHTRRLLDFFETIAPDVVSSIIPGIVSVTQLTVILRALARDQITLRHFDLIMQAIAEGSAKVTQERQFLEEVRIALGRIIVRPFMGADNRIEVLTLDPLVDIAFAEAERGVKVVDAEVVSQVMSFLETYESRVPVVVGRGARALVADCLRARGIGRPTLAFEEMPREARMTSIATFQLEAADYEGEVMEGEPFYDQ